MQLRDYQQSAIDSLRASIGSGKRRPVLMAPTGAGKTVIASEIIDRALHKGGRALFTVPSLSLVDQTVERFYAAGIKDIGVIQANHEMTNSHRKVQVASVQTLMRRSMPDFQVALNDECHIQFDFYRKWFSGPKYANVPIIGLSATPWAKGMGKLYDDLIISTTTKDLIEKGVLSNFKVFAPSHPDLTGVKTVAGDYEVGGLAHAMDNKKLVADIVSTWLKHGKGRQTLCFAVNRKHAQSIQEQFKQAGVNVGYVDAFSTMEERQQIERDFKNGDIEIVCNVGVLTTGVDWDVRCIILARPTKSEMLYVQIIGRGLRTAPGKDHCLILDHSDTTLRLGFVTDIHHTKLDDGTKGKAPPKTPPLPKECPKCAFLKPPRTQECPSCGFKAEAVSGVTTGIGELLEITPDKKTKKTEYTMKEKEDFYAELLGYSRMMGYKPGWVYWAYKDKFGVNPMNHFGTYALPMSPATAAWVKNRIIAQAKMKQRNNKKTEDLSKFVKHLYGDKTPTMNGANK